MTVSRLSYAITGQPLKPTHKKICISMLSYYTSAGTLTPNQMKYLSSILSEYTFPDNLEILPFRDSPKKVETKQEEKSFKNAGLTEKMDRIIISFSYDSFTTSLVKSLQGRRWNPSERIWTSYLNLYNVNALWRWGFHLSSDLRKWKRNTPAIKIPESFSVPGLKAELMDFQVDGLRFMEERSGSVLLGDDMGLGKTIQALAYLQLHPEKRPVLVVSPSTLKWNWRKEILKFMDGKDTVQIIEGRYKPSTEIYGDIVIINYDILSDSTEEKMVKGKPKRVPLAGTGWWTPLAKHGFSVAILDEAHKIKNFKSNQSIATTKMLKKIPIKMALSGTFILNRPKELFVPLSLICPGMFLKFTDFAFAYCGAVQSQFGLLADGATNTKELYQLLTQTCMIRRLKRDVLKDLPPKTRSVIPLELTNRKEYQKAADNLLRYLAEIDHEKMTKAKRAEHLVRIETLKGIAVKGKIRECIRWIKDFLESEEKLVIFARHQYVIDALMKEFGKIAVKVDGGVKNKARIEAQDAFQEDPKVRVFVGNLEAASEGLTLTSASNAVFLELAWSPGGMLQGEDRICRKGQTLPTTIWYLLARDSIEVEIMALLERKSKVLEEVLDGSEIAKGEGSIFDDLLKRLIK